MSRDMCSEHGWLLQGQCGGINGHPYWSNTTDGTGHHYSVFLDDGQAISEDDAPSRWLASVGAY